jgi:hypothetical protein
MADPTSKSELLEQIRAKRAEWEALVAQLGGDRWTTPGVEGDWSFKDVLAHVAYYEQATVKRLRAAATGTAPQPNPATAGMEMDERNHWVYEQQRARPLAEVQADEQQAYDALLSALEPLSDEDLFTAGRFAWLEGDALWEVIPGNVHDHYDEHIPPLRAWLAQTD